MATTKTDYVDGINAKPTNILSGWEYEATADDIEKAIDHARELFADKFDKYRTPEKCASSPVFVSYVNDAISRHLFDNGRDVSQDQLDEAVRAFFARCAEDFKAA